MNTSQRELDSGASTLLWRVSFFRFVHMTIQGSVSEICVTSIRYAPGENSAVWII